MLPKRNSKRHRALIAVLIQARIDARKSQRELSAELEVSELFTHRIESGERMLSAIELPEYAAAVDLTPDELIARMFKLERDDKTPIPTKVDGRRKRAPKKR